jgi:uncharacterized membrane protein HdeD (DUF308 family)
MMVLQNLSRNWWTFAVQGVVAILLGILAIVQPGITLQALILLFAIWAIVDGVLSLIASVGAAEVREPWWPLVFKGLLGLGVGLATLKWPDVTALTLLFLIAFWSILSGVTQILASVRLREEIQGEVWLFLGGVASVLFGVLLVVYPSSGILAVVWLLGIYAIIFGVTAIMLGFRLRSVPQRLGMAAATS